MCQPEPLSQIIPPLLDWFGANARTLPWRSDPQPYRVWVSEIMLQQTRVAAVLDYFERFMAALPTVTHLAQAEEEQLFKLWQGLGYYNRARNLQKAARQIVTDRGGVFPSDYEQLLKLPGVGEYTAGAIASIAFGQAVPAVDGNVLRVVARLTGDKRDIAQPQTKAAVREALAQVIPVDFPGQFNQALMELGALVCLPNGAPLCAGCPLSHLCRAHLEDRTEEIPRKAPKKMRRVEERTVCLIFCKDRVALRRRPEKGLLASLWEFPNYLTQEGMPWDLPVERMESAGRDRHIFTHIEWRMTGVSMELTDEKLPEGWIWASAGELESRYAVPNAFRGFLNTVLERLERGGETDDL